MDETMNETVRTTPFAPFEWLLSGHPDVASVVETVSAVAEQADGDSWRTVRGLTAAYPGDPGIAISLLLHTVVLARGEALYLPAGNIHAYQEGLGIELMGPSDNVLRGGLTPKHIDVPELLSMLDFRALPAPRLTPLKEEGVTTFAPEGAGFRMQVLRSGESVTARAPSIAVVLDGAALIDGHRIPAPGMMAVVDENHAVRAQGTVLIASR